MTQWRLIIMLITTSFVRDGTPQANTSLALIWSTTLTADGRGSMFFLYGDPNSYRDQMQRNQTFNNSSMTLSITRANTLSRYMATETDFSHSRLYFSHSSGYLNFGPIALLGTSYDSFSLLVPAVSNLVTGLSVDWISNLLYWSDAVYLRICVVETVSALFWRPVVESGLTSPQDVAVYPIQGLLFWTDSSSKIERLDLATNNRQIIVNSSSLQRPTTLVIDFVAQRLLWLDSAASRIGFVNFDGSGLSFWSMQLFSSISSFAILKDYIFLGDRTQSRNYAYTFAQRTFVGCVAVDQRAGVIDMTVHASEKQPSFTSPCSANNGGCNHLCVTKTATERVCQCSMGFFLDSDGSTCNPKLLADNFLLVSDQYQYNIYQVDLATGEVRAASVVSPLDSFSVTAMDYDTTSNAIYVFDSISHSIRKVTLANQTTSTILEFQDSEICSLAVDTVERLLYYVNNDLGTINRASLSGEDPRAVVSGDGTLAKAIALDTRDRLMFWSDCSNRRSIEQAQISNPSIHQSVVTVSGLCATAIAIDALNRVIYWADSRPSYRLEQVGYGGSGRLLIRLLSSASSINGLAVDATFVYISGSIQRQIQRINRNTGELSNLTGIRFTDPYALALFSSERLVSPTSSRTAVSGSISASTGVVTATTGSSSSTPVATSGLASTKSSTDTTVILVAVICGSVVLIAVIVTLGFIFGRRCKKNPQRNENQQMDDEDYSRVIDSGRIPTAGNVETVSGFVGATCGRSLPPHANNYSQRQAPPSRNDKYMSIYPPTYAELIKSDMEPPEPPPRSTYINTIDSDDYMEISA